MRFNCVKGDYVTFWCDHQRSEIPRKCVKSLEFRLFWRKSRYLASNDRFWGICFDRKLRKRVPNWIEENHIFSTWQGSKYVLPLKNAWNTIRKPEKITTNSCSKQCKYYLDIRPKHHVLWYTNLWVRWTNRVQFRWISTVKFQWKMATPKHKKTGNRWGKYWKIRKCKNFREKIASKMWKMAFYLPDSCFT